VISLAFVLVMMAIVWLLDQGLQKAIFSIFG
jgi:preprotein translocase subunit SecE